MPVLGIGLKHGQPGSYDFGTLPSSRYRGGDTAYVPVNNSLGLWKFSASPWSIGGGRSYNTRLTGVVDTGTTMLLLSYLVVQAYYTQVPNAANSYYDGGYVFQFDVTLPDFPFKVGSNNITIPGRYINYAPVSPGSKTCFGGNHPTMPSASPSSATMPSRRPTSSLTCRRRSRGWAGPTRNCRVYSHT